MKNKIIKIKDEEFIVVKGGCEDCCLFDNNACYIDCDTEIPFKYCLAPKPIVRLKDALKKIERLENQINDLKQPTENKELTDKIKSLENTLKYYL
jgi:hypothetical protein